MTHSHEERTMKMVRGAGVLVGVLALAGAAMAQRVETRGVTPAEIVLGRHPDLADPAATNVVSSSNAVKMRFDEVNEKGGIAGRKIKLIVEDTQYQVPRAVQAGAKLINRDRIFAMVAGLGTPMNNALFKDQLDAGVPNLFPLSAARSMFEPFHKLKFYGAATYVDQVRAGISYFVTKKGKKAVCAMYQDTDFGKEVLDGIQVQVEKMKIKLAETTTHKPTDQDFTAQITKLKAAGCDLVVLGTIVRDSIVPYSTARKIGWTDVDFLGSAASYDLFVAAAKGGRWVRLTDPLTCWARSAVRNALTPGALMQIEPALLFSREEFAERLDAVRVEMRRRGIEVLLIDELEHLFYIAGWHASGSRYHACIVPVDGDPIMILRRLDEPGFLERTWLHDYVLCDDADDPIEVLARTLERNGWSRRRIGVETDSHYLPVQRYEAIKAALPKATFLDFAGVLWELRLRKSPQEISYLALAASIVDRAMAEAVAAAGEGRTERDVAAVASAAFIRLGADTGRTGPITSGPRSGSLHGRLTGHRLAAA